MMDNDDDGFDLIRPSLIQQLRTILDQYPDDGQILKELIQNAEDAGASKVKLLHDKHSYGTEKLHSEGLAQFQGPALYAYNDAQFTKDDWKGIRMLCDSIKVKDPMKVGRFGLGFKSVFHVTDLPSIVSSSQIGVIDPHEEYFGDGRDRRTGHRWRMKEDRAAMDSIPDQFLPYKGIFDCTDNVFSEGSYNGTLFRFPLRTTPSKLSQTLYSAEKVHMLFESFMADAHLILLFLQYLESIELYVREKSNSEARKTFQVRISDDSLQLVREKRREFRSEITTGNGQLMPQPVKVTYPITIETLSFSEGEGSSTERHSFLVTNYVCGGKVSSQFESLATDGDLSYLPLVGVAMALPDSFGNQTPDIQGHVFCFLPLPMQKTSLTGLPVHVNGFFALNQNRRYIKTPNAEQEDLAEKEGRQLTDKSLLWNQCLLEEAIPRAYATMLMEAINEKCYSVQAEAIYKAWPDINSIDQKWKRLQNPLFELLCTEEVVYTPALGGNWLNVEDVIFNRVQEDDPKELLERVFLKADQNVASLPGHVLKALGMYTNLSTEITPLLARKVLKETPSCYRSISHSEKLLLLKFVFKDGKFSELLGLELLPVSNGLFTSFSNSGEAIYISSPEHPRELLPCLQDRFLVQSIDENLLGSLQAAADQGCTQLRHLCKDNVTTLLSKSLPSEWSVGENVLWYPGVENHPPKDWLGLVWDYLGKNVSTENELKRLQNLPLLPIDMSQVPVTLARLTQPSKIVVRGLHGDYLDDTLNDVLKELGVTVLQEYPNFISLHPAVTNTFVQPPSTQGVLRAMAASLPTITTGMHNVTDEGLRSLRKFVAKASSLEPEEKKVLHCLPLFETLSKAFVSKKEDLCAAPGQPFPVTPRRDLIDIKEDDSKHLAVLLDIRILTPHEFLLDEIFPGVEEGRYAVEEIDKLMAFVMERYKVYAAADGRFKEKLKALPFVLTKSRRVRPIEIFDPRGDSLKRIFTDEDIFPAGEQYNDPAALVILEDLGMKGEGRITGQDLYQSAKAVSGILSLSTAEIKSEAIVEYLTRNPSKLQETACGTTLGLLLQDIPWVPRIRIKPSDFPQSLTFWGETSKESNFHKPSEVKTSHLTNLVGSVKPVVKVEASSQLSHYFSWNMEPTVFDVTDQLNNVVNCYNSNEKPRYIMIVDEIYAFLSRADHADVVKALRNLDNPAWIWNGDGFSSPSVLLSEKPPIDLSPYICSLPSEVLHFSAFFASLGLLEKCDDAILLQVLHLIKQKYDSGSQFSTTEVKKDLQLSVDILNEVKPKVGEQLPSTLQEKVLIPTHVEGDAYLKLAPVEDCMYCEHEWLERSNHDQEMDYLYVHPNIPNSTAELLLVPTLMNRMLNPEELEIGEEFGQEEKLTRRLSRLLEDYTDGFAVPKELVQNADDAGATEVRFLYDERTNEDARACLIDEEMRHCQGPALWLFNDAEFRDEDFANITKLNGAAKESDTEKIGKFGLGFNAVYNLTDVPMFVSRNYFVIFDPNTFYLGKAIRNKNKPGMKIDINKNTKRLRNLSNQFKPFNGIFDCDLRLEKEDNSFHGTLFRFPLRTKEQAIKSEIKQLHYDNKQVEELLDLFTRGAKTLLLFTQNVRHISVFHLPRESDSSQQPMLLFEVSKSLYQDGILRELSVPVSLSPAVKSLSSEDQYFLKQCNVLRASSEVANCKHTADSTSSNTALPSSALTINIKSTITQCGISFLTDHGNLRDESEIWLVASSMGKGHAMQFARSDASLLPSAGVAAQLMPDKGERLLPVPVVDQITTKEPHQKGILFCYLPLPIYSGFPVHVNGAFAVASSRRGLKEKTTDDKDCFGVAWNDILMQDSICAAYLDLLEDVKKSASDAYQFHSLWPKACEVQLNCEPLARSFYQNLFKGGYSLFSDGNRWVDITQILFLEPNFRQEPQVGDMSFEVFQLLNKGSEVIIDMPADVYQSFGAYELAATIQAKSYDKVRFFRELFFPNIALVPSHLRNYLLFYAIYDKTGDLSTEITPALVRKVLKKTPSCYRSLSQSEKLLLLKFVLKDDMLSDLPGLELLPVSNGLFTSFSNSDEGTNIYISSPEHPPELLPGLQDRFLDQGIDENLLRSLRAVADQGCTQLRHLCKDNVAKLLSKSLPPGWSEGENVLWYPGVENHPPKDWLKLVWDYLGKNFATENELKRLQNLPLLPVNMSQVPVTLARLAQPSNLVVRSFYGDCLDDTLTDVLKELGVIVLQEYPNFISLHPAVTNTFVQPPSTQGVLRAMAASLPAITTGMHNITDEGKRSLRKFVAKAPSLEPEEKKVLHCLPLFETLSKAFVSKKEDLCAAPGQPFPVTPRRDLIDIKEDDSKHLAVLLDIRILTPHEFLLDEIFPGVEEGRYAVEEIDKLMAFVMERYKVYAAADGRFKEKLKALPFVSTKSKRVRPIEIFDPRGDSLKRIFTDEDIFPAGEQYNDPAALVILEDLGMKGEGNITGQDLYQSAKAVSGISSLSAAEIKSEAIVEYLTRNPSKLQETACGTTLGLLLQDIPWVPRIRIKPSDFPQSLTFWGETSKESNFHKPSEVKTSHLTNLVGSVKPVVKVEASSQLSHYFSWNMEPTVFDVTDQLNNVVNCYNSNEKPRYIMIVDEIYAFLSRADHADVVKALRNLDNPAWIWNGDGFSSPSVLLSEKPPIDLSPYICSLPSEVLHFSAFFASLGLLEKCDDAILLQVLHLIKQKYDSGSQFPTTEVKKDLQLSVDILNEVKPKVGEQLPSTLQEKVLIPTHVEGDAYLKLAPVEDCMYCEHEWLERSNHDQEMDYLYVHPNIPNSTAELLLVPTLMNRMLNPEELEIGEEFGQEEKLTRRLSRLLEDYTDGFAVPKELVQNADDAGATEVRFLYDERTNEDARTCLIDEEMRHCQGPALWLFNDAEFRDEDFANITKLNGAAKESDTEKIGKFGLGFNAVYNLTDVPMFVSRNYFVIFDPNTFYLGKAIRNKNKPGMKIDINKNTKRLRNLSNQFKPFNGIFDCDLRLEKEDNSFHGTLFRFPLRTKEQAIKSEIKQLHYDNKQVEELLDLFTRGAKTLLLFTQNVRHISVFHLPRESDSSQQPMLLFEVSKSLYQDGILRELSVPVSLSPAVKSLSSEDQYFLKQCNVLRASSEVANCKHTADSTSSNTALPSSALTINIKSTITQCGISFLTDHGNLRDESEIWLVASSMGKGHAMQFARSDASLLPSAGVAAQLMPDKGERLLPVPVVDQITTKEPHQKGILFCYLPLPIYSGFPVHVNGAFAVASSRRGLKEKTTDDKDCFGVAWNDILMQDSICAAYLDLLEDVKKSASDAYQFHSLWPKACEVQLNCEPLARSFYQNLFKGGYSLFSDGNRWVDITQILFLEPNFRQEPQVGDMSFEVFQLLNKGSEVIIDMPADVYQSFGAYELAARTQAKSYDKVRFFRELFFPNIALVPSHLRNYLLFYAIDDKTGDLSTEITPALVRKVLKETLSCYRSLSQSEKLLLLQFVLKDDMFSELLGLELLPVSNGLFTSFSNSDEGTNIYISSPEHPPELLPGLQDQFLDQGIDENLLRSLRAVADQGCTQLRHLCKDNVAKLLSKSLPPEWSVAENVLWYPGVENHPPKDWLKLVWNYLGKNFATENELKRLQNLPLLPVNMSHVPVTLARLAQPSNLVVRSFYGDCLDDTLTDVLKELGVIVLQEYPNFISLHPAVTNTFVQPPSTQGVLRAMAASLPTITTGMHNITDEGKRSLRKFVAKASSLEPEEKNVLHSLPLFETLSKAFVSKKDGLRAAPEQSFPVPPRRDLIDVKEDDSKHLAVLLDIRILTPHEFLLDEIFPGVEEGHYAVEEIDKLMAFVMERYKVYAGADCRVKEKLKALPFVSTKSRRVRPMEIFDPRRDSLRKIFTDEDVFPAGEQYNDPAALVILEDLGMKGEGNITGQDLYQSAKAVSGISSLSAAEIKTEAIVEYLTRNPSKLQETACGTTLGLLLQDIPWVPRIRRKPSDFPRSLTFWGETSKESNFHKPSEVKSNQVANLVGSVKPVVKVESSSPLSRYFSWNTEPTLFDVTQHLKNIVSCYNPDEKPHYILIVKEIYAFLSVAGHADVVKALRDLDIPAWIWNGDGFSSPSVLLSEKPPIDLSPYICSLPSEVLQFSAFFGSVGLLEKCDDAILLQVLHLIKHKYDSGSQFSTAEVKKDLQLSVDILNEVKPKVGEQLPPALQEKVLIPTHVEEDVYLKLAPVDDCMYCEHEWLERSNHDQEMDFLYVHPNIPNSTAELLLVPTLMNRMLDPDELEIGEEFGQEEKLTRRLNRLLEDYTDGFAVPKELVQNADDAGATEIRFLYDERTNEDAMACLIDEEMRHCQGPALWVYNDAEFRDEDFANITKLNGATKEGDTEKIGKFGLGFNAVYNLTDVPMFVSRNYFVIFDPNTFYLGKAIKNKNKPGMKIDINKNTKRLRNFSNQFKPFNGIFDCDLRLQKEDNSYHGTLFRFPLRTKEQASKSEIKQLHYDNKQVEELLNLFTRGAKTLLLFTQNVRRISVFHLPREAASFQQPILLFEVSKSLHQGGILRELTVPVTLSPAVKNLSTEDQYFLKQCNVLRASSEITKHIEDSTSSNTVLLSSALTVSIKSTITQCGRSFLKDTGHLQGESESWLVASSMGKGNALQFAKDDKSLIPSAGVAAQLLPDDNERLLPVPVVDQITTKEPHHKGNLFCYLPLPIYSGFPVHVNGAFAVAASRRGLKEKTADDKDCFGVEWNNILMQDSICAAYLDLLEDVKKSAPATYQFHSLWPKACEVQLNCEPLARSFYHNLVNGGYSLFSDGNRWVDVTQMVFLEPNFRQEPQVGDMSFEVFQLLNKGSEVIIDMPADVYQSFAAYELAATIQAKSYDKGRFFRELFFPNIALVPSHLRNNLVLYALDDKSGVFDDLLKTHACIPVSPDGQKLKCPGQLINPYKTAALLFIPEDERFPFSTKETFLNSLRLAKLEQLGILTDDLPWSEVAERAQSISMLNRCSSEAALTRIKALVDHLDRKRGDGSSVSVDDYNKILQAKFLPVLRKPEKFPLPWKGDELQTGTERLLLSPMECYLKSEKYLVCCTEPILDLLIPTGVEQFLHLDQNQATVQHVTTQLDIASSANTDSQDVLEFKHLKEVCMSAYRYFQRALNNKNIAEEQVREIFHGKKFILSDEEFVYTEQVAFRLAVDCSPYLYQLPQDFARSFDDLMKKVGVKVAFEDNDFISCLKKIKQTFGETELDDKKLQVAVNVAVQLGNCLILPEDDCAQIQGNQESFYLPDSQGIMQSVGKLCMRDCPWLPDELGVHFVNDMIPPKTSGQLGIKTRREEALLHFSSGIPFGQREKLTNRLKRILTAYPCEKEILKELLQNADDAQATEIYFIKDPRKHQDERVFADSWKPLQGPALCVYNNKPFTEADIVGIQSLGEGSKGDDPNKTGQYGVGFNAVYHLTDVPTFVSSGEEIGDVLCVLDPHHKYVPRATAAEPGRMFRERTKLKKMFPDVFSCYIEHEFPIQNSTMFRFPLRTQAMANVSKISKSVVTLAALDDMMEALKRELFEVLLFVNSVRKITLCDIDEESGKVVNAYVVEAEMSEEDAAKRKEFATYVKQIGKTDDQRDDLFPNNIEVKQCSYVLNLRDSLGNKEKWLIVQQAGFENEVQRSIVDAYKRGDLGMLPRGGVACLLEKKATEVESQSRRKKAYCFLPLPIETDLPVHINGHFALDHEARRNLWRDEATGYRSDWNNALLTDVIASCYLTLLDEVRGYLDLPIPRNAEQATVNGSKDALVKKIKDFEELFPLVVLDNRYWENMVRSVYQGMDNKRLTLLPVVQVNPSEGTTSTVQVTWLPPTGKGKSKAFFNNLGNSDCFAREPKRYYESEMDREKRRIQQKTSFEEILLQTGFNLVKFSLSVFEALQKFGVNSPCVSPSSVMEFYKTFNKEDPHCWVTSIPVDVSETPFKNADGVTLVLKYCKDDEHFFANLPGLPLLLTQDDRLRQFSHSEPKFLSRHHGILPQCREMFVHNHIRTQIFGNASSVKSPVFKRFGVQEFASNLHQTLPSEYFSPDGYVHWCPTQGSVPNKNWVDKVWTFLDEETKNALKEIESGEHGIRIISVIQEQGIRSIRAVLQPLSNWSILPCTETIQTPRSHSGSASQVVAEHFLVPLRLAESVLDFTGHDASSRFLVEALRKLSLAEVNYAVLSLNSCYSAPKLVASLKTPASLLKSLEQKMTTNPQALDGKLTSYECRIILQYFSDNVASLQERDKKTLRRLPFYQATHGGLITLNSERVCVLTADIPRGEMDEFGRRLNVVFLETCPSLSPLFKFLAFQCVSSIEVYCNFILQHFGIFSKDARMAHLKHIRDSILPKETNEKQKLLDCLSDTAIITSRDGTLKKASSFYEPDNDVFSIMLSEDMFPPEPFNTPEWLSFLKEIGLICDVSQKLFKTFARDVEREGASERTKSTYEKSEVLVKHLFSRKDVFEEGLLRAVCDVRFVATTPVSEELRVIHGQFGEQTDGRLPYIAFKGSLLAEHAKITWTTASLLPHWANPRKCLFPHERARAGAVLAHLEVFTEPTLDLVTFHCQNVSRKLEMENDSNVTLTQKSTRMSVMRNIYRFLQEKANASPLVKDRLQHTPCLLVEEGGRFVYAKQVVIELYESLEIKPFLYRMPAELSEFTTLFKHLGCSPSVTPSHYAMVLGMLHGRCKTNQLHPNEVDSALKAVKGLFGTLQETPEAKKDISALYLPATNPFSSTPDDTVLPVVLRKATELIFDDAPHYHGRIQDFNLLFLVDLKRADVCCKSNANFKDVIMLLPPAVRPQMMSCVIEEKFTDCEDNTECFDVGAASALKTQLHSEQFYRGIVRLIHHANQDGGLDESVVATVRSNLQSIEFLGMSKIVTHLVHKGNVIRGSEIEVSYFLEKVSKSGEEIWKVYVNAVEDAEDTIATIALTLTQVIEEACKGLLRNTVLYIPDMLRSQPGKICSLLDRMKIRQDNSYDTDKGVFPPPGSFIPIVMHNLLNPAFEAFTPGEYVGYELHDPSLELLEGDATFIYAVIIEEVPSDNVSHFNKFYKINIGDDKQPIVEATKLYKFHRLQEVTSSEVVLSDQQGPSRSMTDKQQIFEEITRTLEEAWRLPEDRRRQIIKRLFLQWHPDKNPGNEVFCTEVFQHIKNEIERLERGESRRGENGSSGSYYRGSYGAFYGFWEARARRYNSQRREYRDNFFRNYGSSGHSTRSHTFRTHSWEVPPSFCTTNPQPRQARRWFRQAEADLAAADNDIATLKPSYEWACFKCHQAAEKALKAAQYSVDAYKTNVHNLVQNALTLDDSQLTTLSSQLEDRVGDSTRMRYPDQVCFPQIPNDVYSREMARNALELATMILDKVRSRVR
ncbi:hypothetical protein ACROYT_G025009 [Oculina patagonica]